MSPRITGRFRRTSHGEGGETGDGGTENGGRVETQYIDLESVELTGVFAAPRWLRDLGFAAWLLAGVNIVLVGLVGLAALTSTIVVPVVVASVLAAVLSPVVGYLERHGTGRGGATVIVFIGIAVLGIAFALMLIGGITNEASSLTSSLGRAADKIQKWLQDLGVSQKTAGQAKSEASSGLSDAFHALLNGIGTGIAALASLAVFLSFTALSLFFLLKDGPAIRAWVERHLGVPRPVARIVVGRTLSSLRGYFVGVTIVAAFNGVVIGLGALILNVPDAGSIAVVNFVAAYIPYLGAWSAGIFTVLLALGAQGTATAIAMAVIVLLANGALQQMVQPIAMGAALGIHPLAVLIVTIAAGALFGTIGMVVAAPLTAAAVRVSSDLAIRKAKADAEDEQAAGQPAPPGALPAVP